MPDFLPPDSAIFELHAHQAVIRLLVEAPAVPHPDGWSVLSRATLCVVDGPGDVGYLLARMGVDVPDGWDEAFDAAKGSTVIFGQGPNAPSMFVRSADMST
jgi:hypothetical protein